MKINSDLILDNEGSRLGDLACTKVLEAGTTLSNYTTTGIFFFDSEHAPTDIPIGVNGFLINIAIRQTMIKQIWFRVGTINSNDWDTCIRTVDKSTGNIGAWHKILLDMEPAKMLSTQTMTKDNITVDSKGYTKGSISLAKSGYTPVAIHRWYISNATTSGVNSSRCFFSSLGINNSNLDY